MRDFKLVMGYELKRQLAKKTVIVTTVILMAVALVVMMRPWSENTAVKKVLLRVGAGSRVPSLRRVRRVKLLPVGD